MKSVLSYTKQFYFKITYHSIIDSNFNGKKLVEFLLLRKQIYVDELNFLH